MAVNERIRLGFNDGCGVGAAKVMFIYLTKVPRS